MKAAKYIILIIAISICFIGCQRPASVNPMFSIYIYSTGDFEMYQIDIFGDGRAVTTCGEQTNRLYADVASNINVERQMQQPFDTIYYVKVCTMQRHEQKELEECVALIMAKGIHNTFAEFDVTDSWGCVVCFQGQQNVYEIDDADKNVRKMLSHLLVLPTIESDNLKQWGKYLQLH